MILASHKGHLFYDSLTLGALVVKHIETENRIVVARFGEERRNEGLVLAGSEFLLWRMKIYWR